MKKIAFLLLLIQSGFMMAQTETVATINGKKIQINPNSLATANNGLTITGSNIQLGGALTKPSVLTTSSGNTFAISGLQSGAATDNILVADGSGVLKTVTKAILGDNLGSHSATTDLSMNNYDINNVKNLDVKGTSTLTNKVYAKTTAIAPATGVSQLAVDNATGEIYKVGSSTDANAKPLSYVTYTISNVNGDWISDYNTKIPSNKYTVVVVGYSFSTTLTLYYNSVPPVNVISFVNNGYWYLTADYKNSGTSDSSNGTWTINCLVLNNSMTSVLAAQTANLNGFSGGSATTMPVGL
jgi:hypothetical protein